MHQQNHAGADSAPRDASATKPLLHGLSRDELTALLSELGEPAYRSAQLWNWLYIRAVDDWTAITNLPNALKAKLSERVALRSAVPLAVQGAPAETRKVLAGLFDGERIEEVLIPARNRRTVCVSSQAGCRFHCAFCASGQAGFRRNLRAGEMVGQVLLAARDWGDRPTHVVFMGIGEPFDNYDAVLKAVRIINDPVGLGIGARRITISTCGVIPGIQRLAQERLQVELSVSLHAADDATRSRLMPVNRKYPLAELIAAVAEHTRATGRIVTFEYTLIKEVNDSAAQAHALARLLARLQCRVNLIPLSPVEEFDGQRSAPAAARVFIETLCKAGINATLRDSKGGALKAACGQLRYGGKHG